MENFIFWAVGRKKFFNGLKISVQKLFLIMLYFSIRENKSCMESVRMQSFFYSVFPRIRAEHEGLIFLLFDTFCVRKLAI